MRAIAALVLAASIGPLGGCSLASMSRAPARMPSPERRVRCTSSRDAPALDVLCAAAAGLGTLYYLTASTCGGGAWDPLCTSRDARGKGLAVSFGLATVCGLSAMGGFDAARRCDEVKEENRACMAGDSGACLRLSPAWTPAAAPGAHAPLGGRCRLEADCAPGLRCAARRCANPPEAPGARHEVPGVGLGLVCRTHGECREGLSCPHGRCVEAR